MHIKRTNLFIRNYLLFIISSSFIFSWNQAEAFNCNKAKSSSEKFMCSNWNTFEPLDRSINQAFSKALGAYSDSTSKDHLKSDQRIWLKERDNFSKSQERLTVYLSDRIRYLQALALPQAICTKTRKIHVSLPDYCIAPIIPQNRNEIENIQIESEDGEIIPRSFPVAVLRNPKKPEFVQTHLIYPTWSGSADWDVIDANFDGYADLILPVFYDKQMNPIQAIYLFNQMTLQFDKQSVFEDSGLSVDSNAQTVCRTDYDRLSRNYYSKYIYKWVNGALKEVEHVNAERCDNKETIKRLKGDPKKTYRLVTHYRCANAKPQKDCFTAPPTKEILEESPPEDTEFENQD